MSTPTNTQIIKKALTDRKSGSDRFADDILALRQNEAHKSAGFTAERPFYKSKFGISSRALSDWTHAGRIRAALTEAGVDLNKQEDAGVTAYTDVTVDKAPVVVKYLNAGETLKQALLGAAGYGQAAFEKPQQAFEAVLGGNLPPAFEALQLSLSTLAFNTSVETLKEGQAVLWECYQAMGIILEATEKGLSLSDGLEAVLAENNT